MKDAPLGARGEASETVEFKHTLTAHHLELPPVYSTPDMIRLMETAAFRALQPYCEADEITVERRLTSSIARPVGLAHKSRQRPCWSPLTVVSTLCA